MNLEDADQIAKLFQVLAYPSRLELLMTLDSDAKSANDLNSMLWIGEAEIEKQLRILSSWGLVVSRPTDENICYQLNAAVVRVSGDSVQIRVGRSAFSVKKHAGQELPL